MKRRDLLRLAYSSLLLPLARPLLASTILAVPPVPKGFCRYWRLTGTLRMLPRAPISLMTTLGAVNQYEWLGFAPETIQLTSCGWPVEQNRCRMLLCQRAAGWDRTQIIDPTTHKMIGVTEPIYTRVDFAALLPGAEWRLERARNK